MNSKKEKLVRFYNEGKQNLEGLQHLPEYNKISSAPLLRSDGGGILDRDRATVGKRFGKGSKIFPENNEPKRSRILDPGSEAILQWNRIFLFSCLMALFVDPLFFYLPSVQNDGAAGVSSSCMMTDLNLGIVVTCLRTIADAFYLIHIVIKFRTAYVSPSSRVFGRGELVMDPHKIARRYLKSDFIVDVIATLPLPQIVIWFIIPAIKSSHADHTTNALELIVLLQYIPRLYLIFPLSTQIIKATGVVAKTAWAGAAYNLLLYMLASHVLGASWYLLSIERHATCWKSACRNELGLAGCSLRYLDCGSLDDDDRRKWANTTTLFHTCDPQNTQVFKYGIFGNAVTNNVVSSDFLEKYFYCLWWGLQNLSSYGQTLSTSTFIGETSFAILIAILGLVLFSHLIGNMQIIYVHGFGTAAVAHLLRHGRPRLCHCPFFSIKCRNLFPLRCVPHGSNESQLLMSKQGGAVSISIVVAVVLVHETYLESMTVRLEEWRLRQRDTEEWMRHRQLPQDLQERVRRFVQYKWVATHGVDEESILQALPSDLRRDIQRHLCLDLVRRVPFFSQMDGQLLDAICERLVSSLCTQGTYIVREGDPVTEMLFIIRGTLESSTTNGGRTGFFNSITLRPGDFCGEELLAWALLPKSTLNLPSSTRTVKALNEVEAFALEAEDLKFVANQFRRLHSKKLQHTFRFYSYHWRTWAACFIQVAWRRFKKRKMAIHMRESFSFPADEEEDDDYVNNSTPKSTRMNLGVTILASRFAANTKRGVQKSKNVELLKLQKPEEPDFSVEPDDD